MLTTCSMKILPSLKYQQMHRSKSLYSTASASLTYSIKHHLGLDQPRIALAHFLKWQEQCREPDKFTIPSLLKLSMALREPLLNGQQLHCFVIKSGHSHDLFICTALVEMYFKYSPINSPVRLFEEMPQHDVALFGAMVSGFVRNGFGRKAVGFFFKMLEEGIGPNNATFASAFAACSQMKDATLGKILHCLSTRRCLLVVADVILQTSLLDMYAKCGNLRYSKRVFGTIAEKNVVSWNCIIDAFYTNGLFGSATGLFREMITDGRCRPRSSMLVLVLSICGLTDDLRKGKEVHSYVLRHDMFCLEECNAILDMYAKAGDIDSAIRVFERPPERDVVTWTAMISGYGTHGLSSKALDTFDAMKTARVRPDGVAFLSVLTACSHAGLVQEGREIFASMQRDYDIAPDAKHFACMTDLYGRVGLLEEAFEFVRSMPVAPSKFIWGSLLSSCRNHKNLKLGEFAARKALQLDPCYVGSYVLLSRLYSDAQHWEGVARVRSLMKDLGLKADTAYSWVTTRGKVYKFSVGDRSNVFSRKLLELLKNAGFTMDTSVVGHNVHDEEERVNDLCGHTEKAALAFVVTRGGDERLIRIGKNLRVCRDCHQAFKFASEVFQKEIILKDPNRYHRFSWGRCSCSDFW